MNIDLSQLQQLNQLDFDKIYQWPPQIKWAVAVVLSLVTGACASYFLVFSQLERLTSAKSQETELRRTYMAKSTIAATLDTHRAHYGALEDDYSRLLQALPSQNETPGLLDDITYIGTTSGLSFQLLSWLPEIQNEFYTELPIQIEVTGGYHDFGKFVANLTHLPRIVTLHDFSVRRENQQLTMQMQAKTYRTVTNDTINPAKEAQ